MVAAANKALSATADGNQKKPGFPGFIPPGANPQQVVAALAARPAPNVLAGTGLGMGDPMNKMPPLAPAVGGELAPAFGSGLYGPNARYNALPQDNSQNVGAVAVPDKPIKPVQPGFIPERSAALDRSAAVAQPQAAPAAALAARPMPDVAQGTGLGLNAPAQAPAMFTDGLGPRPAPQPEPAKKMGWNDVPPLRAPDNARNIYANMGVDDLKSRANLTGVQSTPQAPATAQQPALAGLAAMEVNNPAPPAPAATAYRNEGQNVPAPQAAPSEYSRQMGSVANFFGDAASGAVKTLVSAPGYGLSSTNTAAPPTAPAAQAAPAAPPYRNEGQNYPAGGKAQSPAVTTAPAGEPQRNASGALTNLGTGTDVGFGVTRYNIPGQSPLFTNKTGDSGAADNMALMNRGAPTAQNAAAMDNLVARSEKQISDGVKMLQHQDQVAAAMAFREAQARQEQSRSFAERLNNPRSEESVAINNLQRQLKPNLGESPAAFAARTAAVQAQINAITGAESLSSAERQATNQLGFKRDELTAKQQLEQSNLGLKRQQVGNELATGEQSRDAKGMEIAASKQLQSLRDRFMAATGAEQEALGKQLLTMSGKDPKSSMKENFMVVGGGQEWDAQANSMRNVPQTLIDLRTGKPVGGDVGGAKAPTTAVDFLKKNPSQAQAFKDKYGYLPEGFKQ